MSKCPNFMCLGAAKSGTTSLYDILIQHPDIYIPMFKEPHFFDIPENYSKGIEWYKNNYYKNIDNQLLADFTPSYLFEKKAARRIFNDIGRDIKFLIIIRHPVDRAYSHYLHSCRDQHEDLSFPEAIKLEDKRLSRFLNQGDYLSYLRHSYFHQSLYGDMIEEYLKYFPLKNFLFIHFEDEFIRDRNQTILRILDFLEIRNDIELDLDFKSNPSSIERSKILKRFMKRKGWWRHLLKLFIPYLSTIPDLCGPPDGLISVCIYQSLTLLANFSP